MNFELTDEQRAVRDLCREFAREVVAPAAPELDEHHRFPLEIVKQMGDLGLFGIPFPETYGGSGGDFLSYCIAVEELSRADAGVGITLEAAVSLGIGPIHDFGSDAQRRDLLPDLLSGRRLWAFGLTEPGAGSDAGATTTRAELVNEAWRINGAKQFITNSGTAISAGVTITAVTGEREISALLVPIGTPGYRVLPPYRKLGWHSSDTHPLAFDDCEVPEANLLGARGGGYRQLLRTLMGGRVAIAALSVGCPGLPGRLGRVRETRRAFGRSIAQFRQSSSSSRTWRPSRGSPDSSPTRRRSPRPHDRPGSSEAMASLWQLYASESRSAPPIRPLDPQRLRLHRGLPGRALLPRRQDQRDRRRHQRDPADPHREVARHRRGAL